MDIRDRLVSGLGRMVMLVAVTTAVGMPLWMHRQMQPPAAPKVAEAIRQGDLETVARADPAELNELDEVGWTPLMRAAQLGRLPEAALLIERGVDVNAAPAGTALMVAAAWGRDEMVSLLLRNGADVGLVNRLGHDALFLAASANHAGCVKLLLEAGADPLRPLSGETALSSADGQGNRESVRVIRRHQMGALLANHAPR